MISQEAMEIMNMLRGHKIHAAEAGRTETGTPEEKKYREMLRTFEGRRQMEQMAKSQSLPEGITVTDILADQVHCEWQGVKNLEPEKRKDKVILFLHGGGFTSGSALTRRTMSANIARHAKVDVLSVNYRLSPEYMFPAALQDCETAFLWLMKQGYKPEDIVVMGESAGANLSVCLVHFLKAHHFPLPGGVCAVSPVVDLEDRYPSRVLRANRDPMIGPLIPEEEVPAALAQLQKGEVALASFYCTVEDRASSFASPIHGDFHGFPRLSIHVGSEEILYDDAIALRDKAAAAGVDVCLREWEGLFHSFPIFSFPEAELAWQEIARFVRNS